MNIVIIVSSLAATGPGFIAQELANHFVLQENNVLFIALSQTNRKKISLLREIEVQELDSKNGSVDANSHRLIRKLVEKARSNVIISNGIRADNVNSKIKKSGLLRMSISHNNPFEDYPQEYGFLKGNFMALIQFYQFRKLNTVVTLNPALKALHEKIIGENKVELVLNGVPDDICTVDVDTSNQHLFGNVAVFNHRKNQELILETLGDEDIVFWGDGPLKAGLKIKYTNKNITWMDFEINKQKIFDSFKVYISASRSEGMPLSVLEAISAGKPLLLSRIPAHEFITQFLPNDTYCLFSNISELKAGLEFFQNNENNLSKMKKQIRDTYFKYFTSQKMSKNYVNLIQKNQDGVNK